MIAPVSQPNQNLRLVRFRLGDRCHAVRLEAVERALRAAAVTPVPDMPEAMLGILDLAGELLPVLSVRRRFGEPQAPIAPEDHFLVARMGERRVVLAVDAVDGVLEGPSVIPPADIVPGLERLEGVARLADGLVLIHDLEAFFSPEEWHAVDRATRAGEHAS